MASDVAGWFARWLLCQELTYSATTIFTAPQTKQRPVGPRVSAAIAGLLVLVPIVFAGIIGDWWGLANGISMVASVIVRQVVPGQNRCAIDRAVDTAQKTSDQLVKVFLTIPNGRAVTIITTRAIVVECVLTTPRPPNPSANKVTRAIGWVAFGTHVISLGMTTLFCQILSVCLLIMSTVLAARQVGADRWRVGRRVQLQRADAKEIFRSTAYARLQLTPAEENCMVQWNMFPQKSNQTWWDNYRQAQNVHGFHSWDEILASQDLLFERVLK